MKAVTVLHRRGRDNALLIELAPIRRAVRWGLRAWSRHC